MFDHSAELYDLIYLAFKDYRSECAQVAQLLRGMNPQAISVLDVACGTGEHARLLAEAGFAADGLDINETFLRIARGKHPTGRFFRGDMCDFQLPQRYDVVICLFSSIGYVVTLERLAQAFRCFRQHLAPTGIVLIEPWFPPGVLDPNRTWRNSASAGELKVERVARITLEPRVSRLHFDYEITDGSGTHHTSEVHEMGLFTHEETLAAFTAARLVATYDPQGLTGRGLYVATLAK